MRFTSMFRWQLKNSCIGKFCMDAECVKHMDSKLRVANVSEVLVRFRFRMIKFLGRAAQIRLNLS